MNTKAIFKQFMPLALTSIYFLIVGVILSFQFSILISLTIIFLLLILWKILYGLANHNFLILFDLFLSFYILSLSFNLVSVFIILILILSIFYLQTIWLHSKWKEQIVFYNIIRELLFALTFFITLSAFYSLFYLKHWPFTIVFLALSILSMLFIYWYNLLDNTKTTLFNNIIFWIAFVQILWFLFNFSNGFFIFPIISVFWFHQIHRIRLDINKFTLNEFCWHILFPLLLTVFAIFYIKI